MGLELGSSPVKKEEESVAGTTKKNNEKASIGSMHAVAGMTKKKNVDRIDG